MKAKAFCYNCFWRGNKEDLKEGKYCPKCKRNDFFKKYNQKKK